MSGTKEVYVEGLPFEMDEIELKKLFGEVGNVVRSVIPRWHDTGRLRGYAIFEFATAEEAEAALKLDKKQVSGGRYLSVTFSKGRKMETTKSNKNADTLTADEQSTCKALFIGNLPYEIKEDELNALFNPYGAVEEVRIVTENGRTKGFAYIEFKKAGIVKKIVGDSDKKKFNLKGRALVVDFNAGVKRAGFHVRKEAYDSEHFKKKQAHQDKRKNIVKRV